MTERLSTLRNWVKSQTLWANTAEYRHDFYNLNPREYVKMAFKKFFSLLFFLWMGQQVQDTRIQSTKKDICENHL